MKHCDTCDCPEPPQLRGFWQSSMTVGGCNFCTQHLRLSPPSMRLHEVLVMHGNHLQVRMCRECYSKFILMGKR